MSGTKGWIVVCGAIVLALGGLTWAKPAPPAPQVSHCDMSNVQPVPFCKQCGKFVETEDVEKGKHKVCSTAVQQANACVKTYYVCLGCMKNSKNGGMCITDKKEMTKTISKSRMIWRCPTCSVTAEAAGQCNNATCKVKRLVQSCELSGTVPHVRVWPK